MNSYLNQSTQQTNSVLDQINKLKRMNELGYDGYMASIAQHQKPVEAIKPAYANPEPSVKPQTEALKALTAEQLFSPVVAEPVSETNQTPEENGYWGNIARGIGERATQLVGHGAGLVGQVADLSLQGWGDLLGYTYAYNAEKDDWEWIEREEYKRLKDEGLATSVLDGAGATFTKGAEALQNADLGYEEKYGWHSTKEIWNDANASLLGKIGHTLSAGVEQGLKSIPDMVAVASNPALLGAYIGARAHEIGEQRAINDGKDPSEATLTDTVVALPFAGASALTEKIATQALLKGAGNAVKGMGGGALKTIGTATAREGIQETVQESIEYAGESALTQKGWQEDQAKDRALAGAVLGSVFGGVMGTGQAGIKASHDASNIYHQGDMVEDVKEIEQASQNFSDYGVSVTQSSPAEQASEAGKEALKAEVTGDRTPKFDPNSPAGEPFKRTEATANHETVQEAPIDRPETKKVVGKKSEVYTDNAVQPVTLEIVEASDLEASTKISDNQPRNRDSEASRAQIQAIANDLRPRRLADTDDLATGAPVISRKGGAVIAGNGRLSAIQLAYKNQNEGSQKYKDYLIEHAEDFGMQSADIKEFNQPVLIRRFNHDVDIQRTAINSNSEGTLKMSMLENAQADAKLLPDLSALKFNADGEINEKESADFIRAFIGNFSEAERGGLMDKQGLLSPEGRLRLNNAILARAFPNEPFLNQAIRAEGQSKRNILKGILNNVPLIAQTQDRILMGEIKDLDISKNIAEAFYEFSRLTPAEIQALLNQNELFADGLSAESKQLLGFFMVNKNNPAQINELIHSYYQALNHLNAFNLRNRNLFANDVEQSASDLLQEILNQHSNNEGNNHEQQPTRPVTQSDGNQSTNQASDGGSNQANNKQPDPVSAVIQKYGTAKIIEQYQDYSNEEVKSFEEEADRWKEIQKEIQNEYQQAKQNPSVSRSELKYLKEMKEWVDGTVLLTENGLRFYRENQKFKLANPATDENIDDLLNEEAEQDFAQSDLNQYTLDELLGEDNNNFTDDDIANNLKGLYSVPPLTQDYEWEHGQRKGLFDLPNIQIVKLTGNEFGTTELKELQEKANEHLKQFREGGLFNRDTGWDLRITSDDRKKITGWGKVGISGRQAQFAIKEIVERAVLAESHQDEKHNNPDVVGIHRLYAPVEIAGTLYRARLTVRDYQYYDPKRADTLRLHSVETIELEKAPMGTLGQNQSPAPQPTSALHEMSIRDLLQGSKRHNGTNWVMDSNLLYSVPPFNPSEFIQSAKQKIKDFVQDWRNKGNLNYVDYLDVSAEQIIEGEKHGLNLHEYRRVIDKSTLAHIEKRHTDPKIEQARGQIAITDADIELIPEVVSNPDYQIYGSKNELKHDTIISIKKLADGQILVIEEVRTGRRKLAVNTMWKHTATQSVNTILDTLSANARNDSSRTSGLIVVEKPFNSNYSLSPNSETSKKADPEKTEALLKRLLGKRAEHIQIHHSGRNETERNAEGAHYRKGNQSTHIYMEAINPLKINGEEILSQEERTVWVAWHELFHRGGTAYGMEKLRATLKDAKRNRLVRHIANEKIKQYAEQKQQLDEETAIEEALAELEAGLRLGRMDAIVKQYGQNLKDYNFIQKVLIEVGRVINKIIRRFAGAEKELSNQEVFDLIRGVSERSGDELVIHKEIKLIEYKPNNQFPAVIHQAIKTNEQTGETLLIEYQPSMNYPVVISEQMKNISPELKTPAYNQELAQAIWEINSGKAIDAKNFDVVMPYFHVLDTAQQNKFIRQLLDDLPAINQEKIDLNQKPLIINGLVNLKTYQPTPFEHIQHKGFKNKRGNSLYSLAPTEEYNQLIDDLANNDTTKVNKVIELGRTPDAWKLVGIPDLPVKIRGAIINKVMRLEHAIRSETMKLIPAEMNDPVAIMKSAQNSSNPKGYLILTSLSERDGINVKPVVGALNIKFDSNGIEIINVASIYGRTKNQIETGLRNDLLYWNEKKGSTFRRTFGVQFPSYVRGRLNLSENIKTEADLSQYQRNNNPLLSIAPEQSFNETANKYGEESAYLEAKKQGKTELTYRQWVQVRTPEFKAWFGDWENRNADFSVVINSRTKEPLVVRHFTGDNFTVFDDTKADGFWFTDKKELDDEVGAFSSDNVIEVFLNIREPTSTPNYDLKDFFADNPEYDGGVNSYEGDNGEFTDYVVINPNQIKSATDNTGEFNTNNDSILYSLSPETKQNYDKRIDELFNGSPANHNGVIVLDRSDLLDLMGLGNLPVRLVESKVNKEKHPLMTAQIWKQIPYWLDSPAFIFNSSTNNKRLVFFAPTVINNQIIRMIIEPNVGKSNLNLLVNAYETNEANTFINWTEEGKLRYVDTKKARGLLSRSGLQLSSVLNIARAYGNILTQNDLNVYRRDKFQFEERKQIEAHLNLSENDLLSDVDSNQPLFSLPPSREIIQKEVAETVIKMGGQKGWRISGTNLKYKDWIDAHTPSFQNYLIESGNELSPQLMENYKNGLLGLDEIAQVLLSLPNYVPPSVQTQSQKIKATLKKIMGGDLAQKWFDRQIYLDELAEKGGKLAELVRNSFKNFNARSQNQLKKDLMPIHEALKNELGQAFNRFKSLDRYKDFSDAKGMEQFLLDLDQIGKYVFHGLERNQYIKQKTNGKDEAGSGLTDDEIKLAIQTFNSAEYGNGELIRYYDQLYKNHLRKFIDYSDKVLSQAGLLTQQMKANRPNYQYYVPLFGDTNSEEDSTIRVGSGQKTDNLKNRNHSAEGRHGTEADNLFANIYLQAETAVKRAQMQETKQRLLDMALDPNGKVLLGASVQKTTGWRNPHADEIVYQDGQDFYYISIRNKKALEAMKDFNALPFVNNGILETPFAWAYDKQSRLSKFMASTYTRWNPNFIFRNKIMDSFQQWQLLLADAPVGQMTQANGLKGYAEALKNVGGRFGLAKKAMAYNIKWTAKGGQDTEYQRLLARYAELGGVTTYASFLGRDSLFNLQEEAINATRGKFDPRRYSQVLSKTFDGLNNYLELTTRISAFKALLDYGVDEETAMNYVKNVMNFETKGDYARHLGNFYPFFTTALYDARRTIKALKTKEGQVVLAGLIGFVLSVQALIASVTGADDDGVAWVDKYNMAKSARGFIIPMTSDDGVMRGEGVIIPFGFGLGRLAGVLANSTRRLANGAEDGADFTSNLVNHALIGGFSPIHPSDTNLMKDPSAWALNTFLPQTIKPLVQHSQNKNYQGKAIYADERFRSAGELDHNSGFFWTADTYQITAKALYDYLGVDVAPESLAFFVSNYLGGIGQTGINIAENALDYVVGEGNQSVASWYHQVPILGGFTQQAPNIDRHRYLTQMEKARNHYNQVVHDAQSGTLTQADNQKIADAIWWHELYKQQNKQIMAINKQLKEARKVLTGEQLQIAERRAQALIHAIHIQVNQLEKQHRE